MATFGWGSTVNGELGLGGIEEDFILTPREIHWTGGAELEQAACGTSHTLLLTKQGKVFSCGNNDYGQLGHDLSRKRPQFVSSLDNYMITQLSSGAMHSMALNEWGQVFTWGSDTHGQLGNELGAVQATPRVVRSLSTKHVIQIVSGHFHCLALTNSGEIYAWGMNNYGQLGIGQGPEKVSKPMLVEALSGIPIAFICCGAHHSFALSTSGAIFAWGKNNFGQLGLNNETHHYYPQQIRGLRSLGVRHIACGDDFSVFLTADGRVFTCGLGSYGQLGHGAITMRLHREWCWNWPAVQSPKCLAGGSTRWLSYRPEGVSTASGWGILANWACRNPEMFPFRKLLTDPGFHQGRELGMAMKEISMGLA
uniref:RCC1-like domain-containing protein n=1 Tax=Lutzomyia longipalpis TaxID=7200 RepID=A0A1B0CM06_LUTLO